MKKDILMAIAVAALSLWATMTAVQTYVDGENLKPSAPNHSASLAPHVLAELIPKRCDKVDCPDGADPYEPAPVPDVKTPVERPSEQVVVDKERMEYIVTFACIKHTAVVRAKAQDTARKAGKTEYKMPKDTFKRCVKWVEYELKMKKLFEA